MLDKNQLELIAEYVMKGIQSSKQEVSGLHRELREDIREVKEISMSNAERLTKLENFNSEVVYPVTNNINHLKWLGKTILMIILGAGSVIGAILAVKSFLKDII